MINIHNKVRSKIWNQAMHRVKVQLWDQVWWQVFWANYQHVSDQSWGQIGKHIQGYYD